MLVAEHAGSHMRRSSKCVTLNASIQLPTVTSAQAQATRVTPIKPIMCYSRTAQLVARGRCDVA